MTLSSSPKSPNFKELRDDIDSADLDAILELERSPGYALVRQRMVEALEKKRMKLEIMQDPMESERTRGMISMLRDVLEIPGILKEEIKQELDAAQKKGR